MNLYALANLLTSLSSILLGIFVFLKGKNKLINKTFSLWAMSVGVWSFGIFRHALAVDSLSAMFWSEFLHGAAIFIPTLFFQFTLSLIGTNKISKRILLFMYLFSLAFFFINFSNFSHLFMLDVRPILTFKYFPRAGIIYPFFVIFFSVCVICSLYLMLQAYHKYTGIKRNQIKYIFWGALLGYIGGSSTFMPMFGVKIFPYGNYFVTVYVIAVCYAIVKYHLMDIDIVIKKGLVYAYLSFSVLVPCMATIIFAQNFFFGQTSLFFTSLAFCTLLLASMVILRVKPHIEEYVEKRLFKRKFEYKKALTELSKIIISFLDEKELFKKAGNILTKDLGSAGVSFFMLNNEKKAYTMRASQKIEKPKTRELPQNDAIFQWLQEKKKPIIKEVMERSPGNPEIKRIAARLDSMESEVCIPLMARDELIGIINLGHKSSGEMYSHEDLDLLAQFAAQASIALENSRLYQEMQQTHMLMRRTDRLASLGSLTANLAHEIRNPMVTIKTFLDLFPQRYRDKEFRGDFLKLTSSELDRLNTLVTQLLSFARPTQPNVEKGDINQVLEDVINLVTVEANKRDIAIDANLQETRQVLLDADQMKQVFLNIFLNAFEAIKKRGSISVMSRDIHKNGNAYVQVEITDDGKGIPEKILEHIFDPFFTTKQKGGGLGLSISHQIVQEHKGTIQVESRAKKGTTFLINIPCKT